jgi:hypothetical protein
MMVLRDACADVPKQRLHSIFPKRQIANTKDERSSGGKTYVFLIGCLDSLHNNREKRGLQERRKHSKLRIGGRCGTTLGALDLT